ncbi:hypothetical protein B0J12DRAFT_685389 [Macrophomina phaseolina]|uniref:Uncharacterized protein n=1 Tax=Macrophomina phaseolina TaxID=35725 RepID=A0ABQ8FTT4_9PEZI|nr:hypothetical protein B0J12DRAFT_685389 [Macrophomina phaseolina]
MGNPPASAGHQHHRATPVRSQNYSQTRHMEQADAFPTYDKGSRPVSSSEENTLVSLKQGNKLLYNDLTASGLRRVWDEKGRHQFLSIEVDGYSVPEVLFELVASCANESPSLKTTVFHAELWNGEGNIDDCAERDEHVGRKSSFKERNKPMLKTPPKAGSKRGRKSPTAQRKRPTNATPSTHARNGVGERTTKDHSQRKQMARSVAQNRTARKRAPIASSLPVDPEWV